MTTARYARGLLRDFAETDLLTAPDVHVAQTLGRLGGETDDRVLLAAAIAVRAARLGSVCVDLGEVATSLDAEATRIADEPSAADEYGDSSTASTPCLPWPDTDEWLSVCEASPLVAGSSAASGRPLRLVDGRLYLDRYWQQEQVVRRAVAEWSRARPPTVEPARLRRALGDLFPGDEPDHQRLAAAAAAAGWLTIIAGGPGTGKTTTVARLLVTLHRQADRPLRVALAAPTGKAAARLQEAVAAELDDLQSRGRGPIPGPYSASTVHRLLGARPDARHRFRYNRQYHLPHDVVVIDEASMLSLTLVSRVLEALREGTRLILVGDPDQLVSVEAGAVLGDLAHRPARSAEDDRTRVLREVCPGDLQPSPEVVSELAVDVVRLRQNHRFEEAVGLVSLADAVRAGRPDEALAVLRDGDESLAFEDVDPRTPQAVASLGDLRDDVVTANRDVVAAALTGDAGRALTAMSAHRLICGHRDGPYGVSHWRRLVSRWLQEEIADYGAGGEFYVGRPLLVTANDYDVGVFNGDMGVVVLREGRPVAAFSEEGRLLPPSRLSNVQTPHALTVHKAQGSEAERVTVVLPPPDSPLLTRELLYTAITRARRHVRVVGTSEAVARAVERPIVRASGLRYRDTA